MRCMLLGMDEGFSRISLSTADLERQPGDMLFDKVGTTPGSVEPCQVHDAMMLVAAAGRLWGACCLLLLPPQNYIQLHEKTLLLRAFTARGVVAGRPWRHVGVAGRAPGWSAVVVILWGGLHRT